MQVKTDMKLNDEESNLKERPGGISCMLIEKNVKKEKKKPQSFNRSAGNKKKPRVFIYIILSNF